MRPRFEPLLLATLLISASALAQQAAESGGGAYDVSALEAPMPEAERAAIEAEIGRNVEALASSGKLGASPVAAVLSWPLATTAAGAEGYHGISNFVDQNSAFPNQVQDFNCGTRSYDLASGYNHRGTDLFTWPFPWYRMDHDQVQVVAAAPGTIVLRQDGNPDRSCAIGNGTWNAVYVRHDDGSTAWYGHMKKNSLTPKTVGQTVARGEVLGVVGSSGSSSGPHLHFELYDADGRLVDPFAGACNRLNTTSWWQAQPSYYDSAVNQVMTGDEAVVFPTCPQPETSNARDRFAPGERVYFTTFYRDQRAGQPSRYTIRRPDGSAYRTWTHSSPQAHYAASYWYWAYDIGAQEPLGAWTFEVAFGGKTYAHPFTVTTSTGTEDESPKAYRVSVPSPNPFRAQTQIEIEAGQPQHGRVAVYDLFGRLVAVVHDGPLGAARTFAIDGSAWPSGVYVLRVTGETFHDTRLLMLAR